MPLLTQKIKRLQQNRIICTKESSTRKQFPQLTLQFFFSCVYPAYSMDKTAVIEDKDEQQQRGKDKSTRNRSQNQYKIPNRETRFRLSSQS